MTRATQVPSRARPGPRARWSWAGHGHHCPSCWAGLHTQVLSAAIQPEVCLRKLAAVQFTFNVHCLPNTETSTFRGTQPLVMSSSVTSTYFLDQRLGSGSCKLGNEKLMVSILWERAPGLIQSAKAMRRCPAAPSTLSER